MYNVIKSITAQWAEPATLLTGYWPLQTHTYSLYIISRSSRLRTITHWLHCTWIMWKALQN